MQAGIRRFRPPSPRIRGAVSARTAHYWIVDLDPPMSLLAHHLAGDFGYADCTATTGIFTTTPFPVQVHLDRLR